MVRAQGSLIQTRAFQIHFELHVCRMPSCGLFWKDNRVLRGAARQELILRPGLVKSCTQISKLVSNFKCASSV